MINQRTQGYIIGVAAMTTISILLHLSSPAKYTREEVIQMMQEEGYREYNNGYREGMLYAYDNVVVCGASPEKEGMRMAEILGEPTEVSDIICKE